MTQALWENAASVAATWMLTYLVHSTIILGAAMFLARWLQRPIARVALWRIALVAGLLTTTIATIGGSFGWRFVWSGGLATKIAVSVWLLVGIVLMARRFLSWHRLVRALRREPVETRAGLPALVDRLARIGELSSMVRLSIAEDLPAPVVLGPREVCFPRHVVERLDDAQLEAVVAHELAHVRRRDPLWLWLATLLEALFFPQMLHRVATRGLRTDAELVCDDWASHHTGAPQHLAEGLAAVASWMGRARPIPQPCLGEERSHLLSRVERLLARPGTEHPRRAGPFVVLALLFATLSCVGPTIEVPRASLHETEALDVLIARADAMNAVLGSRLLALPDGYRERHAKHLALPDSGAARLLEGWQHRTHPKRGGGAYYSFETRDNDYNREPDLSLEQGELHAGFYGGMGGWVLDLGLRPLASIEASVVPPDLTEEMGAVFERMHADVELKDGRAWAYKVGLRDLEEEAGSTVRGRPTARVGHSYLVRSVSPGEHDLLAALEVTDRDEEGIVFLWRVLRRWPVERDGTARDEQAFDTSASEPWMWELSKSELRTRLDEHRAAIEARLLSVPASLRDETSASVGQEGGVIRLLPRAVHRHVTLVREGGAYYSFSARTHEFSGASNLKYEGSQLSANGDGGLLDIGDVTLDSLDPGSVPETLDALTQEAWTAFVTRSVGQENTVPWVPESTFHDLWTAWRAERRELTDAAPRVGHTYLLRSVTDADDVLVAFRIVDRDAYGLTLVWRMLLRR